MFVAIQLAVLKLQVDEIFLLGCDLGYKMLEPNNFSADYLPLNAYPTEAKADLRNKTLLIGHEIAEMETKNRGVKIYNASGGLLEVHERVSLKDVI